MDKDPGTLLNTFLAENHLEIKLVVAYQGEQSKAALKLFNDLLAINNLTPSVGVSFKEKHGSTKRRSPKN